MQTKIKFRVWPEESCAASAVLVEANASWEAGEAWMCEKGDSSTDVVNVLVEHPDGRVERIEVEREILVEYQGMPERMVFDVGQVRITVKDEEFFWTLELPCTGESPQYRCIDESCPVHGKNPPTLKGPFESWDEAFKDAQKECSVPDEEFDNS